MNPAKTFFEEVINTAAAKTILASVKLPETEQALVEVYLGIATALGMELSSEDILAYFASVGTSAINTGEESNRAVAKHQSGDMGDNPPGYDIKPRIPT